MRGISPSSRWPLVRVALLIMPLLLLLRPPSSAYLALLRQGDAYASEAQRGAAIAAYEEAAVLHPSMAEAYLKMAEVALEWRHLEDALKAIGEAEQRGALEARLERLRMAVSVERREWPAVIESGTRLRALGVADSQVGHSLASAYVQLGDWGAAQEVYARMAEGDSSNGLSQERLGALEVDDFSRAAERLASARTPLATKMLLALREARATGSSAYAHAVVGRVLFEAGEWSLAARRFEAALLHDPSYADAHAFLGYALGRIGRSEEAVHHLDRAAVLSPDSPLVHTLLGLHYEETGDITRARTEYETAYDLDPENAAVCVEIGQTWVAQRQYTVAEIWLRQAVVLQPEDAALWEVLARFYLDHGLGIDGEGTAAAARLVELDPDGAQAHDLWGWAAYLAGDYEVAEDRLLHALDLDPSFASAHYHIGRVWDAMGMRDRARQAYTRTLDLDLTGKYASEVSRVVD